MPWCPKCKTEYRPGFSTCLDCDSLLVDEDPAPLALGDEPEWRQVVEIGAIYALSVHVWYFMSAGFANLAVRIAPQGQASRWTGVSLMVCAVLVLAVAFLYGRYRSFVRSANLWLGSIGFGICLQMSLWVVFVASGAVREAWKLVVAVPAAVVLSGIALVCVWVGALLRNAAATPRRGD